MNYLELQSDPGPIDGAEKKLDKKKTNLDRNEVRCKILLQN